MVSRPTYLGGLGFGIKWDMGWMHDTLAYMPRDPIHRRYHHNELTFRMLYAFTENFMLPLSHDEVVHGKGSLLGKMPGDDWQKFANLRAAASATCGRSPARSCCSWAASSGSGGVEPRRQPRLAAARSDPHRGLQRWVRDLNTAYRGEPALHELDCDPAGFAWIDCNDNEQSTHHLAAARQRRARGDARSPAISRRSRDTTTGSACRSPATGAEILNSDAPLYGGSGQGNLGGVDTDPVAWHGHPQSLVVTLPPLAVVVFKSARG